MLSLTIDSPLAETLEALANQENRPVQAILADMVRLYTGQPTASVWEGLQGLQGIQLPTIPAPPPPLTEDELAALSDRISASGPLSTLIIDERQQGH